MTVVNKIDMEEMFGLELEMCKRIMNDKGGCKFNDGSICSQCGAIPLMLKMINGTVDHRPVTEIFSQEESVYKSLKTEEYMNLLKDLMNITGHNGPLFLRLYYNVHKETLIQEGRDSKLYIIIEELLESNPKDLETCIKIFFPKDILDEWDNDMVPLPIYLQSIKTEIDKVNSL